MYALAERLDPDSLPRARARDVRRDGARRDHACVGEFHYLHHGPTGAVRRPNAMGEAVIAGGAPRPASGSRCSTPATCTAGIGRASGDARRATPWAARRGRRCATASRGARSAPRSTASARSTPTRRASWPQWAAARGAPLHAHVSEQPAENEACLAEHGLHADDDCSPTPARSVARVHRRARDPPHRRRRRAAGRRARAACARRPSATSPTASARRGCCATRAPRCALGSDSQAVIDLVRGGARDRARRAAGHRRARQPPPGAAADGGHRAAATRSLGWPDGGRIAAGALGRPRQRVARRRRASPARAAEHAVAATVFAAGRRATSAT